MRTSTGWLCVGLLCAAALGQATALRPVTPPATQPRPVKNLDRMLEAVVSYDAKETHLDDVVAGIRDLTQTNITVNWPALAQSGVTRDTPVTLHVKELTYEQLVRTLVEVVPVRGEVGSPMWAAARMNYTVGDNTLTLTTNAELGKGPVARIYDWSRIVGYGLSAAGTATAPAPGAADEHEKLLEKVLRLDLSRAGEPMDAPGHALAIRAGRLAASVSPRGHTILGRAETLLKTPMKPGQVPVGIMATASAKRTEEALKAQKALLPALLRDAGAAPPNVNVVLLPGAAAEQAKATPSLDYTISDSGVVLVGPQADSRQRVVFCVFDLRDLIRRTIARSPRPAPMAADVQTTLVKAIHDRVQPEAWGDLETSASSLTPYEGLLIVFAPLEAQRALATALQEMNR